MLTFSHRGNMKLVLYISLILAPCFAEEASPLESQDSKGIAPENTELFKIEKSKEIKVRDVFGRPGGSYNNNRNPAFSNNNPSHLGGNNFNNGNYGSSNLGGSNFDNGNFDGNNFNNRNFGSNLNNDNLGGSDFNRGSSNLDGLNNFNNDFDQNRETILSYSKDYGSSKYRINVNLGGLPWASGTFTYPDQFGRIYTINWHADRNGFYTEGPEVQGGAAPSGGGAAPVRPFGK